MHLTGNWIIGWLCVIAFPATLCAQNLPPAQSTNPQTTQTQQRIQQLYGGSPARSPKQAILQVLAEYEQPEEMPVRTAQYPIDSSIAEETYSPEEFVPHPEVYSATPYSPLNLYEPVSGQCGCDGIEDCGNHAPFGLQWTKHRFTTTVLPGTDNGMGLTTLDLRTQLSLKDFPIVQVTPRFSAHFVDGPDVTDVPNELFDSAVDFSLFLPVNEQWIFLGAVAPGYFSDFKNSSSDAFRVTGRALFIYKKSKQTTLTLGIVYLNREDVSVLPAVGITYIPEDIPDLKFEIMFPKPKISYRFEQSESRERWIYLGGELGGGTWAVERTGGANDVLTYRDLRLAAGLEEKILDSYSWFVEAGYVFSRELEYTSGPDYDLDETGMIRIGLVY